MDEHAARAFARSRSYQDNADAANTIRAYETDWAAFQAWCATRHLCPLPASPETVGAWLAEAGEGYALSTLRRRVAALARAHRLVHEPLDTRHAAIRETLRGIARDHGTPPKQAAAITTEEIIRLVETCDDDLTGLRDRALLLLGFAGALRRSELVGLDVADVRLVDGGIQIMIARSKTDAEGEGAVLTISVGTRPGYCPVDALRAWMKTGAIGDGPLFRKVDRWQRVHPTRLVPDAVRQILRRRAALAGITGTAMEPVTAHGLRSGFVTSAYRNGALDEEIMGHTRHTSLTTMRRYIRRSKLATQTVSAKAGL